MSNSKSYTGEYKLVEDSISHKFIIPTLVVTENSECVELTQSGIKTKTNSPERLLSMRLAAVLSVRCASHWTALRFDYVAEREDGKDLPRRIFGDIVMSPIRVDERKYRKTLRILLALDRASLLFLLRASEMLSKSPELAVLAALFALEVELGRIVPQRMSIAAKVSCLEFAGLASIEALTRLRRLNNLRNQLAHGNWGYDNLGNSLAKLLGGKPEDWLKKETARIKGEGARQVLHEVVTALGDLLQSREMLEQVRAELEKTKQPSATSLRVAEPSNVPKSNTESQKSGVP
jgi:hypothetical protein